jgi:hypothetical protein
VQKECTPYSISKSRSRLRQPLPMEFQWIGISSQEAVNRLDWSAWSCFDVVSNQRRCEQGASFNLWLAFDTYDKVLTICQSVPV